MPKLVDARGCGAGVDAAAEVEAAAAVAAALTADKIVAEADERMPSALALALPRVGVRAAARALAALLPVAVRCDLGVIGGAKPMSGCNDIEPNDAVIGD